jgi:surface protein
MVDVNDLHEFGPQNPTCVESLLDEDTGAVVLDESGNPLCIEELAVFAPFQFSITGSSFAIGLEETAGGGGPALVYNFTVDWGDGNSDVISSWNDPLLSHTYAGSSTYTISISGICPNVSLGLSGPQSSHRSKVTSIIAWGSPGFTYLNNAFHDCYNMTITATDKPDFSAVTDVRWMFKECRSIVTGAEGWNFSVLQTTSIRYLFDHCDNFNSDLSGWNLTGITDMEGVLNYCVDFNGSVAGWDTSAVTDMSYLFFNNSSLNHASLVNLDTSACTNFYGMLAFCTIFNQDISGWTIPHLAGPVDMGQMFKSSDAFNQDIDSWNVSAVTNMSEMFNDAFAFNQDFPTWDTGEVTDMSYMFSATSGIGFGVFNGDISNFDTAKVTNMNRMLRNCDEFNQDISGWDISNVTNMTSFMVSGTAWSTANYNAALIAWALLSVQPNVSITVAATYTIATAQASRDILDNAPNNWTLVDGGGI